MRASRLSLAAVALQAILPARLPAQALKPETAQAYECYVQSAEDRMSARTSFLVADSNPAWNQQLVDGRKVMTMPGNGANPHKPPGALIYDWIGSVFIPGVKVERTIRMLQDYDHRPRFFPEIISTSKLLCRSGTERFGFSMQLKEPAVIDSDNDVVWERVDGRRWRCRSYSTKVREVGKQHNYLLRLNSYWRFAETDSGTYVEGQTITLSGEFGSLTRALGSMVGISPENSLRKTLNSMRESLLKPALEIAPPPEGLPDCGETVRMPACRVESQK